jgi:uncharacterized protein
MRTSDRSLSPGRGGGDLAGVGCGPVHAHPWLVLTVAGFLAGVINAVAGGGSLVSFPALLLAGLPPVVANATNTVAIWPGTLSSVWAYRPYIKEEGHRAAILCWPSLLGGLAGSVLLLHTPERAFRGVVPWLIFFACGLMLLQVPVSRLVVRRATESLTHVPPSLWISQLLISIYGGYFGAGIGILMLAATAIFMPDSLQHANGLKVLFSMLINGIAALYFLVAGAVSLPQAGFMAIASLAGGYAGAHLAQRLRPSLLRGAVVAYGVGMGIYLLRSL